MRLRTRSAATLILSAGLHVSLAAVSAVQQSPASAPAEAPDSWSGDSIEIDSAPSETAAGEPEAPETEPATAEVPPRTAKAQVANAEVQPTAPKSSEAGKPTRSLEADSEPQPIAKAAADGPPTAVDRSESAPQVASQEERAQGTPPRTQESAETEPDTPWDRMFRARAEQQQRSASGSPSANYGAAGVSGPVRNLAKAFTRAIPVATSADRAWANLPLGYAGRVRVTITVDEQQQIQTVVLPDRDVSGHMKRLIDKTILLIRTGRFALSRADAAGGSESLRVDLTIAAEPPPERARTLQDFGLGFEPPAPGRPGTAYFRAWDRYIEAKVTIEASRAR